MKAMEHSLKNKDYERKPIVDVQSVEKSYYNSQVLKNCSFRIYKGEIYGLSLSSKWSVCVSSKRIEKWRFRKWNRNYFPKILHWW